MTNIDRAIQQRELALRLYRSAQAIGEPHPEQCWLDLRDQCPGMTEAQARAIVTEAVTWAELGRLRKENVALSAEIARLDPFNLRRPE